MNQGGEEFRTNSKGYFREHKKLEKCENQELENFLLREMENVDICIELVRIREFDSSGGRIELFKRTFSFVLEFV
jgi:hypothetical protein